MVIIIVGYNYADGHNARGGSHLTSLSTVNIKMKEAKQVWIRAHSSHGGYIHGYCWSYFSGFRL
jgi:hypothetical protein